MSIDYIKAAEELSKLKGGVLPDDKDRRRAALEIIARDLKDLDLRLKVLGFELT